MRRAGNSPFSSQLGDYLTYSNILKPVSKHSVRFWYSYSSIPKNCPLLNLNDCAESVLSMQVRNYWFLVKLITGIFVKFGLALTFIDYNTVDQFCSDRSTKWFVTLPELINAVNGVSSTALAASSSATIQSVDPFTGSLTAYRVGRRKCCWWPFDSMRAALCQERSHVQVQHL